MNKGLTVILLGLLFCDSRSAGAQTLLWSADLGDSSNLKLKPDMFRLPQVVFLSGDYVVVASSSERASGGVGPAETALISVGAHDGHVVATRTVQPTADMPKIAETASEGVLLLHGDKLTGFTNDLVETATVTVQQVNDRWLNAQLRMSPNGDEAVPSAGGSVSSTTLSVYSPDTLRVTRSIVVPAYSELEMSGRSYLFSSEFSFLKSFSQVMTTGAHVVCRSAINARFLSEDDVLCDKGDELDVFNTKGKRIFHRDVINQQHLLAHSLQSSRFAFAEGNYTGGTLLHKGFSGITSDVFVCDYGTNREVGHVHLQRQIRGNSLGLQLGLALSPDGKILAITDGYTLWAYKID